MGTEYWINGLPLPVALVDALESGRWRTPEDRSAWRTMFTDSEIVQPLLYPLKAMLGETSWLGLAGLPYLGRNDEEISPGSIDQNRAVLIADLGPDRLIALDYRESESQPSVVALASEEHSSWRRVAGDIETFITNLGLSDERR